MASTPEQTQTDERQAPNPAPAGDAFAGLEEALSNLARDRRDSEQPPKPDSADYVPAAPRKLPLEASIRPIELSPPYKGGCKAD